MPNARSHAAFPLARSAAALGVVWIAAAGATVAGLLALGQSLHIPIAMISGVVCVATAMLALVPVRLMSDLSPEGFGQGFLLGLVLRLLLTLPMAAVIGWYLMGMSLAMVLGWTLGWYLVLLSAEVVILVRWAAGRFARSGGVAC